MIDPTLNTGLTPAPSPATRREAAQVSALFHGHLIASSTDVIAVGDPPVRYFPRIDVGMSSLRAVDTIEDACGVATRYTIYRDGEIIENAAWSYDRPNPAHAELAGRVAFRDDLVKYEVTPLAPGETPDAEPRSWDENLQPSQRDGVIATNSPDNAPGGGAHAVDIDQVVRHTDSGAGQSQAEHWAPTVEPERDGLPGAPRRPYSGTGSI
jgi:uncharacterized protein (DUF427 family)